MIHFDPDSVANISACIPLVNSPKKISGIGTTKGTNDTSFESILFFSLLLIIFYKVFLLNFDIC